MKTENEELEEKPYINVIIYYDFFDEHLDKTIDSISKEYNGEKMGSGYLIVDHIRDLSYRFYNLDDASNFAKRVRIYNVRKVEGHCSL